jgi:hypothetical protein
MENEDARWGRAYAVVLICLALTVVALTLLSRAHW